MTLNQIIGGILVLGNLLAWPLYQRVAPGMLVVAAVALLAAALGRWQVSGLRNSAAR